MIRVGEHGRVCVCDVDVKVKFHLERMRVYEIVSDVSFALTSD